MTTTILHIDASARHDGSVTRSLSARIIDQLKTRHGDVSIIRRDLAEGVPFVDEAFTAAINKAPEDRTVAEAASLVVSDALVSELQAADIVVIGAPIYNFGVPAAFKAWFDQAARVGITFRYTKNGPSGCSRERRLMSPWPPAAPNWAPTLILHPAGCATRSASLASKMSTSSAPDASWPMTMRWLTPKRTSTASPPDPPLRLPVWMVTFP